MDNWKVKLNISLNAKKDGFDDINSSLKGEFEREDIISIFTDLVKDLSHSILKNIEKEGTKGEAIKYTFTISEPLDEQE